MNGWPHPSYPVVATICGVLAATAGAPDGFATWMLLAVVAGSMAVIVGARHAASSPARAHLQRSIEVLP